MVEISCVTYYIDRGGARKGPFTKQQIRAMWDRGAVNGKTLYCEEGGDRWKPLQTIQSFLFATPPTQLKTEPARGWVGYVIFGMALLVVVIIASQCR